ncbi:MAG: replication protein [Eubacteriales bacterium]
MPAESYTERTRFGGSAYRRRFHAHSNQVLESVMTAKLNGTQRAIIDCVWRQTYGYNRRAYKLSETFIAKATDSPQRSIRRELTALLKANILITVQEPTCRTPRVIAFNDKCAEWHTRLRKSNPCGKNDGNTVIRGDKR